MLIKTSPASQLPALGTSAQPSPKSVLLSLLSGYWFSCQGISRPWGRRSESILLISMCAVKLPVLFSAISHSLSLLDLSFHFCIEKKKKKGKAVLGSSSLHCCARPDFSESFWRPGGFGRVRVFPVALYSSNHNFPCCSYDKLQTVAQLAAQYLFKSLPVSPVPLIFYLCCTTFCISLHANSSCQKQYMTE